MESCDKVSENLEVNDEQKLEDFECNDFDENDEYHEDDLPDLVIDAHNQSRYNLKLTIMNYV
jgi:hypothetical protein